jgi:subtilase family serine protease
MLRPARFYLLLLGFTFGGALLCSAQSLTTPKDDGVLARPSWATPDRLRSRIDGATPITIQVHLPLRNLEEAKAELEAVSDPESPRYGQYLSSEEFESRYSPAQADVDVVRGYLESEGFQITHVPSNRLFVTAKSTAAEAERVFATHLGNFEVEGGVLRRAPVEPAKIPAAIVSHVSTVLGLSTARIKPGRIFRNTRDLSAQSVSLGPPCADYLGQYFVTGVPPYGDGYPNPTPLQPCGLSPPRLRRAYGLAEAVAGGNDGRHVSIAIVGAWRSPTLVADAQAYAAQLDPRHPLLNSQITLIDAPSGGDPPIPLDPLWYYEQLLDVESVHAIAPGAKIVYVGASTAQNDDVITAVNLVVQNNLASIVSNSWFTDIEGASDDGHTALDPIILQAGLKGIGLYFGSGDWGDNQFLVGAIVPLYPASSPYVTAVGGTSLYLNDDGTPAYETGWESGESFPSTDLSGAAIWAPPPPGLLSGGAGGGPSARYLQPRYQRGTVPAALAGTTPARVLPDVAMLADWDSGVREGLTDPYTGLYTLYFNAGGTSLAAPLFAATMALAEQRAGHRLGFANPRLYKVSSRAFRDITPTLVPQSFSPNCAVRILECSLVGQFMDTEDPAGIQVLRPDGTIVPHTLHSAPGFDNVTGLGVPEGEEFLKAVGEE